MNVFRASDLEASPVVRVPTGIAEFDWQLGESNGIYGMPLGMLTVIAAPAGMGKTRLLARLSEIFIKSSGKRVLFMQSEVTPAQFASEKLGHLSEAVKDRFFVTPTTNLQGQLDIIRKVRPTLVIIDSAQQIDEFEKGRGSKDGCSSISRGLE